MSLTEAGGLVHTVLYFFDRLSLQFHHDYLFRYKFAKLRLDYHQFNFGL